MALLLHLNGPPGVGKSALAERYVAEHPGVLDCDVDRLRCLVGGWAEDFAGTGAVVRPVALAMVRAHLDGGRDVVLPQLLARPEERDRFRRAAVDAGHAYVHVLLRAPAEVVADRFYGRPDEGLHAVVRAVVDADGGREAIERWVARLAGGADPETRVVDAGGDLATTYAAVLDAVDAATLGHDGR